MDDNRDDKNKPNYIDVINRAAEALCNLFRENQASILDGQKQNQAAHIDSQKLIIRELMHERRELERDSIENHREDSRYHRMHTRINIAVILLSVIVGFYVGIKQMTLSNLYQRVDWIESNIKTQGSEYSALMYAMTTVRGIRVEGQMYCHNGQYTGPNPAAYQSKLLTADYKLVSSAFSPKRTFNAEVNKKITSFLYAVRQDQGVCAKGAANDKELQIKQSEISNLMSNSIEKLEKEKEKIINRIQNNEESFFTW